MNSVNNLKLVQEGKVVKELTLGGKPIDLFYLTGIELNMNVEEGNELVLKYYVKDVELEVDGVNLTELKE